jgi:ABC-2 type transport system ATP-binding protein
MGKTIVLTTHYMEEAQRLADRVLVIDAGRVVAGGSPEQLAGEQPALISFRVPAPWSPSDLPVPPDAFEDGVVTLRTERPTGTLLPVLQWANQRSIELEGLSVSQPSLEDVYLQLTQVAER